ncbi:hypothetical protein D9M68_971950 [compost metagenome]
MRHTNGEHQVSVDTLHGIGDPVTADGYRRQRVALANLREVELNAIDGQSVTQLENSQFGISSNRRELDDHQNHLPMAT